MKQILHLFTNSSLWMFLLLLIFSEEATLAKVHRSYDHDKTTYTFTILKTTGEPQNDIYLKVGYGTQKYSANEKGVISFEYSDNSYNRNADFFFTSGKKAVKSIKLDKEQPIQTFHIDSREDIIQYRQSNKTFSIEGMIKDSNGEPIEGATISIQGTGKKTTSDEIGLFQIEADFNHPIVVRANGMNNLSLPVGHFLTSSEEEATVVMSPKDQFKVYSSVENMPSFQGGMKAYQDYLNKHLEYPVRAQKAKIEGVVVIQFTVEMDGSISNPNVVRHLEASLDSAALKAIRSMPAWIPASDNGKTVRCKYSLPVAFKIEEPKPDVRKDSVAANKRPMARLATDSLKVTPQRMTLVADSIKLQKDSVVTDTLAVDTLIADTLATMTKDTLVQYSTHLSKDHTTVKAKKRPNFLVRFFRWLFGKNKKNKQKEETTVLLKSDSSSVRNDGLKVKMDSLNHSRSKEKMTTSN